MAFHRHPEGRQPIGVAQQPFPCHDYPLVQPISADVAYLLADLKLVYDDPGLYDEETEPFKFPFHISQLRGMGELMDEVLDPLPSAACVIKDATNRTVFDTTVGTLQTYALANRLMLYVWQYQRNALYLVAHTHWGPEGSHPPAQDYYFDFSPTSAILDARTCVCAPRTVRSISCLDVAAARGDFEFIASYNTLIDVAQAEDELRQQNLLTFNAIPGAGDGVFNDCERSGNALRTLGGVRPTADGRFYLVAEDCTWVRQPIIETELLEDGLPYTARIIRPNSLQIGDNCKPCCDCIDYARTAINLYRLQQKYKGIGNALNDVRSSYHDGLGKWKSRKALRGEYSLDLKLIPQFCPQIDVIMQINNATSEFISTDMLITFDVTGITIANPPTLVGQYAQMYSRPLQDEPQQYRRATFESFNWPNLIIAVPIVGPKEAAHVRFRLEFENCDPRLVKASYQAAVAGFAVTDSDNNTVVLIEEVGICGYEIEEEEEE